MKFLPLLLFLILLVPCSSSGQALFPVRDEGEARDRAYHVVHYRIEVSFDEAKKSVAGRVGITLVPFLPRLAAVELDAESLHVSRVSLSNGRALRFETGAKTLTVHLDRAYSPADTLTIVTEYSCAPKKGLYFTQPDSGYPAKPSQIWTQGEDMDNHFWFPCYDFPNDKATSELIGTVQSSYVLVSNGRLAGVSEDKKKGTRTFHWKEEKPHSSYLIMLAAGKYSVLRDRAGNVPLEYYVYPGQESDALVCFAQTPDMIHFFNERIGFSYPWEKYAQVLIADFIEGGMENTSAAALMDEITVLDPRARVDESPTSLIAHELAHQWWGDVVTCKDWRHLWLNESFASYFDPLYHEYYLGKDEFEHTMRGCQLAGINSDKNSGRKPIVSVGSYGSNLYPRGAAVLHMLRFVLGDTLFWKSIRHYIEKNQFQPVETSDFKKAIEEATGQNLQWFFDEWVYKAGYPVFDISSRWSDTTRAVIMSVRQTQQVDSLTGIFRMPVDIALTTDTGTVTRRVLVRSQDTTFVFPCPKPPLLVTFDNGNWLIKEAKFKKSRDEWKYQAEHDPSPANRADAIDELVAMPDSSDLTALFIRRAAEDPFWAVRRQAVIALGHASTSEDSVRHIASKALIAATHDPKAAVRDAAAGRLGRFRGPEVVAALHEALNDSSYAVMASALRAIARADSANARPLLLRYLNYASRRNSVGNAALTALAGVDTNLAVDSAAVRVRYGEHPHARFTALWLLEHYGRKRPGTLPLVSSLLHDKTSYIRSTAIRMLGDIGDTTSVALLQPVADDASDRDKETAKKSIEEITKRTRP